MILIESLNDALSIQLSKKIVFLEVLSQIVLLQQVLPNILASTALLYLQNHLVQVLVPHRIVRLELGYAQSILRLQPETHWLTIDVNHFAHVSSQKREVLDELVNVRLILNNMVAILLGKNMFDFFGGINETHH